MGAIHVSFIVITCSLPYHQSLPQVYATASEAESDGSKSVFCPHAKATEACTGYGLTNYDSEGGHKSSSCLECGMLDDMTVISLTAPLGVILFKWNAQHKTHLQ